MKNYTTSQIDLAAFLMAKQAELQGIDLIGPNEFEFIFPDFDRCLQLVQEYESDGLVPVKSLLRNRKYLITEIKHPKQGGQ